MYKMSKMSKGGWPFSSSTKTIGNIKYSIVSEDELNTKMKSVFDTFVSKKKPLGMFLSDINSDYRVAKKGDDKKVYTLEIEVWYDFKILEVMGRTKIKLWIKDVTPIGGEISTIDLFKDYDVLKPLSNGGKLRKSRKPKRGGRKSRKNRRSCKYM